MIKSNKYFVFILLVVICIVFFFPRKISHPDNLILQEAESILLNTSYITDRGAGIENEINWHNLDYKKLNQLINSKNIAGYCGLAATFMARKFNEKKFTSLTLNVGNYRDNKSEYFSHVLTLVKVNEKFFVFDLFYGATILDENNNYIDLFTALDNPKKYFYKSIINQDKKFTKHFIMTKVKTDPSCTLKEIKNKNFYVCESSVNKKSFNKAVSDWIDVKNKNQLYWDFNESEDIFLSLIKQGIFNISEYKNKKDFIFLTSEFSKRGIRLHNSIFD